MPRVSRRTQADPLIVDTLIRGGEVAGRVANADADEVIRILAERGFTDGQIAHVLGRWRRSVSRRRDQLGIEPAVPRHAPTNNRYLIVIAPTRPREMG